MDDLADLSRGQTNPFFTGNLQTINPVLESARAYRGNKGRSGGSGPEAYPLSPSNQVFARWLGSGTLPAWSVVRPTGVVIPPSGNPFGINPRPSFDVSFPAGNNDDEGFLILNEPCASGQLSLAAADGITSARVVSTSLAHRYAAPVSGQYYLRSSISGPVRILPPYGPSGDYVRFVQYAAAPSELTFDMPTAIGTTVSIPTDNTWYDITSVALPSAGTYLLYYSADAHGTLSALGTPVASESVYFQLVLANSGHVPVASQHRAFKAVTAGQHYNGNAAATLQFVLVGTDTLKLQAMRENNYGSTWLGAGVVPANIGFVKLA